MSGLFGVIDFIGDAGVDEFGILSGAMARWGPDCLRTWQSHPAFLGQALLHDSPESSFEVDPAAHATATLAMVAEARLDNREELCGHLDIPPGERASIADGTLVRFAYRKWGAATPSRLYGDWSFAAWHIPERKLFLARDHFGQTALYYSWNGRRLAFASDKSALLALPSVSRTLNEYRLALRLVVSPGEPSTETVYTDIHRLIPAHTLSISDGRLVTSQYWSLSDAPAIAARSVEDCADGLREHIERAVASCVRASGPVGMTLSGGLDSGTVAATALPMLAGSGARLTALTSVPIYDTSAYVGRRIGNEFPRAAAVLRGHTHATHVSVDARDVTPVSGARQMLNIHREPTVAVMNQYWILALFQEAQRRGVRVLLTGQQGNGAMSWDGNPSLYSLVDALRVASARRIRRELSALVRNWALMPLQRQFRVIGDRWFNRAGWHRFSALRLDVARRLRLSERMLDEGIDRAVLWRITHGPGMREWIMRPTSQHVGARWAQLAAVHGMVARDPTADVRLMMFAHRVPERYWRGELERWVLRRAMLGRLPDDVRLAQAFGRQSGDLVQRLRENADEVRLSVARVRASELACAYLDVDRLQRLSDGILSGSSDTALTLSVDTTVLMRGIGHGLFLAAAD